jgi:hypothetical protein
MCNKLEAKTQMRELKLIADVTCSNKGSAEVYISDINMTLQGSMQAAASLLPAQQCSSGNTKLAWYCLVALLIKCMMWLSCSSWYTCTVGNREPLYTCTCMQSFFGVLLRRECMKL